MPDLMRRLQELGGADQPPSPAARERARAALRRGTPAGGRRRARLARRRISIATAAALLTLVVAGVGYATLSGGGADHAGTSAGHATPSAGQGGPSGTGQGSPSGGGAGQGSPSTGGADQATPTGSGESNLSDGIACLSEASRTPRSRTDAQFDGRRSAVEICASYWRRGYVKVGSRTPPALQTCVEGGGRGPLYVVPGSTPEICGEVGWIRGRADAGTSSQQSRYAAFVRGLKKALFGHGFSCVLPADGRRITHQTIARFGMRGWTIAEGGGIAGEGFSSERPCVSLAFDSARRVVTLVPMTNDRPDPER